jgi:MFS family permease
MSLCTVFANFFNYLDRGIIPGAASEFDGFIEGSVEFDDDVKKDVDTYLGLLQSAFVVGMSISMPLFANLVHTKV